VARADVQLMDGGLPRALTPGYAICRVALQAWAGCRVLSAAAARFSVELSDGARHELGPADVLPASELSVLNISRRFQRQAAERDFVQEARSQQPRTPAGYRPAARAGLLVRTPDGYFSGKVRELVEDGAYVSWPDGRPPTRVDFTDCAPLPPYRAELHRGHFVLLAPLAPAQRWLVGRIEQSREGSASGFRADGEPFEAPVREVVPLGR